MGKRSCLTPEQRFITNWKAAFLNVNLERHIHDQEAFERARQTLCTMWNERQQRICDLEKTIPFPLETLRDHRHMILDGEFNEFIRKLKNYTWEITNRKTTENLLEEWRELAENIADHLDRIAQAEADTSTSLIRPDDATAAGVIGDEPVQY